MQKRGNGSAESVGKEAEGEVAKGLGKRLEHFRREKWVLCTQETN